MNPSLANITEMWMDLFDIPFFPIFVRHANP